MQRGALLFEFGALGMSTAIVPENGRTQRTAVRAEQRGAVHLSGKPDAADLRRLTRMGRSQTVDGGDRSIHPGVRILLGEQRRGMRQVEAVRSRRDDRASLVHKHGFHTGRADVDSQKHQLSSPYFRAVGDLCRLSRAGCCAMADCPSSRYRSGSFPVRSGSALPSPAPATRAPQRGPHVPDFAK